MPLSFQLMTSSRLEECRATAHRMEVGLRKCSSPSSRSNPDQGSDYGSMYVDAPLGVFFLPGAFEKQANNRIQHLLKGKTGRSRTNNPQVHHYSSSGLDIFAKIVASSVAVGILLIPVFILFLFDLSRAKMAAIVGSFVLVFMVTMSVLVDVTPHDLFIGIAA
jgi:hypothetical protein